MGVLTWDLAMGHNPLSYELGLLFNFSLFLIIIH